MRMMSLVFPNNPVPLPYDQYMFGTDLLVAPIYLESATTRKVTLPALPGDTKWVHVWSGQQLTGLQTIDAASPLGQPPVYYRSDSSFSSTFQRLRSVTGSQRKLYYLPNTLLDLKPNTAAEVQRFSVEDGTQIWSKPGS
ncbi:hypothetical protein EGW08_007120 [Elysia chlorotica]|uniref:Glycosyl hydrolase family 31 C-terminal domain-containing protein n=1 Tax=Elysia chlorotica TaxID=188477 RepID=A0A3S1BJA6_ELYCH|nr:hypothetical protein EGW08_007120 [Elysia chlorotica]